MSFPTAKAKCSFIKFLLKLLLKFMATHICCAEVLAAFIISQSSVLQAELRDWLVRGTWLMLLFTLQLSLSTSNIPVC